MFLDGLIYGSVARNLAMGTGSVWGPAYNGAPFWEHPPLMFYLQSWFFRWFGDAHYTERIYGALVWGLTLLALFRLWRRAGISEAQRSYFWLPMLLWSITPAVVRSYHNNFLDCTMTLFDLWAFGAIWYGLRCPERRIPAFALAVVLIAAAVLVKGPVGVFPVIAPVLYRISHRNGGFLTAFGQSILLFASVAAVFLWLWQYPPAQNNFEHYIHQQLTASLVGQREKTTDNRFWGLLQRLFRELAPTLGILLLIWIFAVRRAGARLLPPCQNLANWMLLMGCAASLPIMMSVKQRSYYLLPALPFYAMGFSLLAQPYLEAIRLQIAENQAFKWVSRALLFTIFFGFGTVTALKTGTIGRDASIIQDLRILKTVLKYGEPVGFWPDPSWSVTAFLHRYCGVATSPAKTQKTILVDTESPDADFVRGLEEAGYRKMELPLKRFRAYVQTSE